MQPPIPPTPAERRLSLLLLVLLAGIAAVLLALQSRYDPSQWQERGVTEGVPPASAPPASDAARSAGVHESDLADLGLRALTPPEHYAADTLSDKINGKAELYLAAGFRSLQARRLAPEGATEGDFLEWYVYDMGRRRNAFAVFSNQRRPGHEPLDLTPEAYIAANGLFMVHGAYYVEIIGSGTSGALRRAMVELARRFVVRTPVQAEALIETGLFPDAERVPESIVLVAANAFGLAGMDWIYTARYRRESGEALAFLARRSSTAEAQAARDAFASYFLEYGGEPVAAPAGLDDARIVNILDTYEIALSHGTFVLGVHEAADRGQALELAARLLARVREANP